MKGKVCLLKNGNLVRVKEFKDRKARIQIMQEMIKDFEKQFPFNEFEFRILHDY